MVLPVSAGGGPRLSLTPQPWVENHASRYSIPRTLPYFANFKSQTISYKQYCDIEGGYRKQIVQRQFQYVNGNRLQVRGQVVEKKKEETRDKEETREREGNGKSSSDNDLLDQHLSKLTLGGIKSAASSRKGKKSKSDEKSNKPENPLDSGSDDSMLIRQAQEIEKGAMLRKKLPPRRQLHLEVRGMKRAPLEPSIVTLVHTGATQAAAPEMETRMETLQPRRRPGSPLESPDLSSADSREWSSMQGTNGHLASAGNSERNESYSYGQLAHQEALIPDCTTVDSPFVRHQPRSADSPVRIYQKEKLGLQQQQPRPLLCEKVRYSSFPRKRRGNASTPQPVTRVGENPSNRSKTPISPTHSLLKRKKKRPKSKTPSDPMKGFGPWDAETDRGSNQTFINAVNMVPPVPINLR